MGRFIRRIAHVSRTYSNGAPDSQSCAGAGPPSEYPGPTKTKVPLEERTARGGTPYRRLRSRPISMPTPKATAPVATTV